MTQKDDDNLERKSHRVVLVGGPYDGMVIQASTPEHARFDKITFELGHVRIGEEQSIEQQAVDLQGKLVRLSGEGRGSVLSEQQDVPRLRRGPRTPIARRS